MISMIKKKKKKKKKENVVESYNLYSRDEKHIKEILCIFF